MVNYRQFLKYQEGESMDKVITSNCLYPRKIIFTNSLGKSDFMYVPCGNCICCQDKKRNEWVSRMSLHSLTHKHCYFITLTYGSYNLYPYLNHPFKEDWLLTKPIETDKNYNHEKRVMPVLLRQEHLTKFFKRLRARLHFPISYCAAGEYGSKFLRPHFHIILWSDEVITYDDVISSWSYQCYKVSEYDIRQNNGKSPKKDCFSFLIGRVDFHDLVSNHTLDFDASGDTHKLSSKHVFGYVAKYVCKTNAIDSNLYNHITSVFNRFDAVPWYSEQQDNDAVIQSQISERNRCSYFNHEYNQQNTLAAPFYDSNNNHFITLKHNQKHYEKVSKDDFVKIFAPFFVCSRGEGIGKKYFLENLERFQKKCYDLPKFHSKTLSFPSYFLRLLKNEKYPIYFKRHGLFSTSYSRNILPCISDLYIEFGNSKDFYFDFRKSPLYKKYDLYKFKSEDLFSPCFIGANSILLYKYSPSQDVFEGFSFNRHSKEYEFQEYVPRETMCKYIVSNLKNHIKDVKEQTSLNQELVFFNEELLNLPTRREIIQQFVSRRQEMTKVYNLQHNSFTKL